MTEADIQIVNRLGLHARPSARVSALAGKFTAEVWLTKDGRRVNAKSIMGVMMLAAARGATLTIEADGPDEAEAVAALSALIGSGFDEE